MTRNFVMSIDAQRNEDYGPETWSFTDTSEVAIDLTGWTFEFRIAPTPGSTAILSASTVATPNGSYAIISDAANGAVDLLITKEDLAGMPGRDIDVCTLAYNMLAIDSFGYTHALVVGPFIVNPGV